MNALAPLIAETASALGMDPVDLATIISYETAGTFSPTIAGPTTQWGQHRGLIQWGEPQAREYGVDWNDPVGSQLGADGAIARYFRGRGWQPGMDGMQAYSIVNAGSPGRFNASDAANGGMPGTVADKWTTQMADHRRNALSMLGGHFSPAPGSGMPTGEAVQGAQQPGPEPINALRAMAVMQRMQPRQRRLDPADFMQRRTI